ARIAAMYAMCTLGTSWNCFLRYEMTVVTRVNGSSRDPYPPTTVSLLTKPELDFRSASTARIGHLNLTNSKREGETSDERRGAARRPRQIRTRRRQAIE